MLHIALPRIRSGPFLPPGLLRHQVHAGPPSADVGDLLPPEDRRADAGKALRRPVVTHVGKWNLPETYLLHVMFRSKFMIFRNIIF